MTPKAFVLSRSSPPLTIAARALGGGWEAGVQMWEASDTPFCILITPDEQRAWLRAPVAMFCKDEQVLEQLMAGICAELQDVQCLWHVAPDVKGAVMPSLLAAAAPVGGVQ